jgi:hypothetical protein
MDMTQMEALELALRLAITAPDRERMDEVMLMADQLKARMTSEEIETVQDEIVCSFQSELELPSWKV